MQESEGYFHANIHFSCQETTEVAGSLPVRESLLQNNRATSTLVLHQILSSRSLVIPKWKLFGRYERLGATMPWASCKLRSGTIGSMKATHQCRATFIPAVSQQAEMTRSMTKCAIFIMQDFHVTV